MYTSILEGIGNTPLLCLAGLHKDGSQDTADVYVKLENRNPGGSVKDRIALYMVERALERGTLKPGGTLIEPTSGNTGIGLALVAAAKGLRCILTMPESMSLERRTLLAAFGAQLVLTPAAQGMAGAVAEAERLVAATPDAVLLGQFTNPDVVQAHYRTTGPEILADLGADPTIKIGALVAGVGTGGTITGTGLYLKERVPGIEIIAVEPAASPLLSGGKAGPHPLQGIGANFIPKVLDVTLLSSITTVSGEDAFATARWLFTTQGISCGITSGANVWAAMQIAQQPRMAGKKVVTFICDTGERYLSTPLFEG